MPLTQLSQQRKFAQRRYVLSGIVAVVAAIYLLKIFFMQVVSDKYKILSDSNVRRVVTIYPARGLILDRKGRKLVANEEAYDMMVIPRQVQNLDTAELCRLLDIDRKTFEVRLKKARGFSRYKASPFVEQIDKETYGFLQEKMYKFQGFYVQNRTLRKYPFPVAAHTLGYVGEVNPGEIAADPYYKMGDYIGKSGLEKFYETQLRGVKGEKIVDRKSVV